MIQHGNKKYPWQEWSDGTERRINASAFGIEAEVLRQQICRYGQRLGRKVQTNVNGKHVTFKFGKKIRTKAEVDCGTRLQCECTFGTSTKQK